MKERNAQKIFEGATRLDYSNNFEKVESCQCFLHQQITGSTRSHISSFKLVS
jgi:hypothetical protein